ncbi:MAG: C4-type zinc ribbon domain-containing protein [Bryobacteraceae bacterium]
MLPDLQSAVRLQEIDNRVAELTREIDALPRHVNEIEKKLEAHQRKLEADRAALTANQRDRKKMESDIQVQEQKISKLKGQMLDAKTNEQYRAFQNEIEFCEREIKKSEDRILELMSESEALEKNVQAAEISLKSEKSQVEAEKQSARDRTGRDKAALAELQATRQGIVKGMSQPVLSNYERIRRTRAGIAVSEAVAGRCSTCHMSIRPQFFQELRRGDRVMYCESCSRILCYSPPISFEELTGEPVPVAREK